MTGEIISAVPEQSKHYNHRTGRFIFFGGLLAVMLLRYFYYGLRYFPYMDDNNMYGTFSLIGGNPFTNIIQAYHTYLTRPSVAFLDAYIITPLWHTDAGRVAVLAMMVVLHFAAILMAYKLFSAAGIRLGAVFGLFFALVPLGAEATYWAAASSRIVVGLFFAVLAVYMLYLAARHIRRTGRFPVVWYALYFVIGLISTGFYEQAAAFYFALAVIFLTLYRRKLAGLKRRKPAGLALFWAAPFVNIGLVALYYLKVSNVTASGSRGSLTLAGVASNFRIFKIFWQDSTSSLRDYIYYGASYALRELSTPWGVACIALVAAFAGVLIWLRARERRERSRGFFYTRVAELLAGLLLIAAGLAPFLVLQNFYVYARNIFIPTFGLALVIDAVIAMLSDKRGIVSSIACALILVVFFATDVSQLYDFKAISQSDDLVASQVADDLRPVIASGVRPDLILFGAERKLVPTSTFWFYSAPGAAWSMMGKLNVELGSIDKVGVTAVANNGTLTAASVDAPGENTVLLGIGLDLTVRMLVFDPSTNSLVYTDSGGNAVTYGTLTLSGDGKAYTFKIVK